MSPNLVDLVGYLGWDFLKHVKFTVATARFDLNAGCQKVNGD